MGNHGVEYNISSDPGIFPYEELLSLSLSLSLLQQSLEENGRKEDDAATATAAVAFRQKQSDAGNLKESTKDNGGGGGREDNEKAEERRREEGDFVVGGENEGIIAAAAVAPGIRTTKSPTMRRKIRHACSHSRLPFFTTAQGGATGRGLGLG